ncbi:DUF883 family protein [Pararhizobium antarcticum]|uniref:DUF883 domain-containing protein n=1 Tax=Pararhizobium antarcticum TaxID=1798805 RepID=A0A657LSB7_9HYPH|nr:DUF883 family protein [Pararhizobium antarcticum]OJF94342.1 hypothetical protein AX761_18620 [Rhizobium sp. 58]OJF96937.1 hypothetical protein AX760_03555 [Pararhizobium antarcticum]
MATGLFSSSRAKKRNAFLNAPVEDQISEIRSDIAALTKLLSKRGTEASTDVRARAHDARDQAEAGLHDLLSNGEQLLSELRARYASTEKQVRHTVREHPVATLGAAALVGIFVAALMRR